VVGKSDSEGNKKRPASDKKRPAPRYPQIAPRPEDLLNFVELVPFSRRWKKLGLDDEDDLLALQLLVMANPRAAPVIEGTHGLRKVRFAPPGWGIGKSGATRILYVYFEQFGVVLLCLVYAKGEADDISVAVKSQLNRLIDETERELRRRSSIR